MTPHEKIKKERKTRSESISSIMRHPKLSRTFADATRSPLGSTARKNAQAMLNVVKKVNMRNMPQQGMIPGMPMMGMGGPGYQYNGVGGPPPVPPILPATTTPPQNKLIFPSVPPSVIQTTPKLPVQKGLFGYMKEQIPKAGTYGIPLGGAIGAGWMGAGQYALQNAGTALMKGGVGLKNMILGNDPNTNKPWPIAPWITYDETMGGRLASDILSRSPWGTDQFKTTPAAIHEAGFQQQQQAKDESKGTPEYEKALAEGVANGTIKTAEDVEALKARMTAGANATTSEQPGTQTTTETSTQETSGTKSGTSTNTKYATSGDAAAMSAINRGIGPHTFAMEQMGDRKSPTKQLETMDDLLRKDFNVDVLQNALQNKINTGLRLEGDLVAFIKSRDGIVNNIDGMLTKARTKMASVDAKMDPVKAHEYKNYFNYLSTLKGNANQRYIDFAKQSITQWDNETAAMQANYDSIIGQYERKYKIDAAITQEDYNNEYQKFSDLYTSLEGKEARDLNIQILRSNALTASTSTIAAAADAAGFGTPKELADMVPKYKEEFYDAKTGKMRDATVGSILQRSVLNQEGLPAAMLTAWAESVQDEYVHNIADADQGSKTLKKIQDGLNDPSLAEAYKIAGLQTPIDVFITRLTEIANLTIPKEVVSRPEVYRVAIDGLAPKVGGFLGFRQKRQIISEEEWIKKFRGQIDVTILRSIYRAFITEVNSQAGGAGGPNLTEAVAELDSLGTTGQELASWVDQKLNPEKYVK